jgi:methylmalonyl-CoA mutase
MPDKSIDKVLKEFFPESDKKDWLTIAMQETNGKDPFEILSWRGKDEILFLPYYDREDAPFRDAASPFQLSVAEQSFSAPREWVNAAPVGVSEEEAANKISLEHLSRGADGLLFDLRDRQQTDFNQLLKHIEWPYCFVGFLSKSNQLFSDQLSAFIGNTFDPASIRGAVFWESISTQAEFDFYLRYCPNFKSLGVSIRPSSPAEEISDALLQGVKIVEQLAADYPLATVFSAISFSLTTDASLVESVAKFKALRMLWYQVAQAYGYSDYNKAFLHLHAYSASVADTAFGPNENMLKGTFAAMGGILGGCDSLTIYSDPHPTASRWARNVCILLREESFFQRVADPLAGAFALESITDQLAAKAWELFQFKWQRQ